MRFRTSGKKLVKRSLWVFATVFVLMNVMAIFHSYKFTHFSTKKIVRTKDPSKLSAQEKLMTLAFGVDNPRPTNEIFPSYAYETVNIKSNKNIECWSIKTENAKGTVVLFHGFSGKKVSHA